MLLKTRELHGKGKVKRKASELCWCFWRLGNEVVWRAVIDGDLGYCQVKFNHFQIWRGIWVMSPVCSYLWVCWVRETCPPSQTTGALSFHLAVQKFTSGLIPFTNASPERRHVVNLNFPPVWLLLLNDLFHVSAWNTIVTCTCCWLVTFRFMDLILITCFSISLQDWWQLRL